MIFELNDIIFFIRAFKYPTHVFDVYNFVDFYSSSSRLSSFLPLNCQYLILGYFFNRIVHLCFTDSWPESLYSNYQIYSKKIIFSHFLHWHDDLHSILILHAFFIFYALVENALSIIPLI